MLVQKEEILNSIVLSLGKNIEVIVVGKPLNMNGTEGERIEETREFIEMIRRRTGLRVEELDERLTTVEADRILDASGVAKENRKEYIDKMAAAIILQTYLDVNKNS